MENWEKIEAVQRMQEYIENNLNEPISLSDLAKCAGYSPFYATRVFKELIGKSPFEYIRALRLSRAALKLRDENPKIIDVALDFVFSSHEGFTRAFSKEFGITPGNYRKNPPPIYLFMPSSIKTNYLEHLKEEKKMEKKGRSNTIFIQVIERPERKIILKRGINAKDYFEYCNEIDCDIWGLLCSIKEALYEPIGMWLPDNLRPAGTSVYVQGVEVPADYSGVIPDGFEVITVPRCMMMVFQGQPFVDEEFGDAIDEIWAVMDSYEPELYGFSWADEDGPRFQLEPQGYRGYIEARPVKKVK